MENLNQDGEWGDVKAHSSDPEKKDHVDRRTSIVQDGEMVNASGHRDQLQRHYGLLSICGLALTIDNAWVALGGSIAVSISLSPGLSRKVLSTDDLVDNGGPAGVLYELLVACFYYGFIAASIAEARSSTILGTHTESLADTSVAHLLHSLRRRCLPLGLRDPWAPLRPRPWLLHRLPQLLRLDIRSRFHRVHPIKRSSADVRRIPSRPGHQAMARLRRFYPDNLVLLRACGVWKSPIAGVESDRVVSRHRWWNCDHHRSRSDAEGACQQLRCMG